jgi:ABC-type sugar transport system permease subunit
MEATASVQSKAERGFKYALLAPAVIWVIGLTFFPILAAVHFSFANYVLGEGITGYVGFDNYVRLLTDSGFWYAIFITVLSSGSRCRLRFVPDSPSPGLLRSGCRERVFFGRY